jgi:superfamily II DNA or RNA helicase
MSDGEQIETATVVPPSRRFFSERERAALYVAEGGECAGCGAPLAGDWHADHVLAYSRGGETDVTNGQALCEPCNLKKGDGAVLSGGWSSPEPLRGWQQRAFQVLLSASGTDALITATPGSGKTMLALRYAHYLFQRGLIDRVVVVVPTDHLREQWKDAAARICGIQLQRDWRNASGRETGDFDGIVVTYQAVASAPLVYRTQCHRRRTLAILDEIHHAGDSLSWGENIRQAFEPAARRLLLSGTPFRSDGKAIPFVRYDAGVCRPDFAYSYGAAIRDQVCRAVMFPRYDGSMAWWNGDGLTRARFRDEIPQEEASRRLRTALDPGGDWLRDVLRDADAQLTDIRSEGHRAAGGLVVCIDQGHARDIAALLARITGAVPTVAVSDDPEASAHIKAFAASSARWIVAVRMVSEGVDIPRLRVGVYATNVISELFFRQVVGRFVRKQHDLDEQVAHLFIPDEEMLATYAERIKDERDQALAVVEQDAERPADGPSTPRTPRTDDPFTPGRAGPAELSGVTFDGDGLTRPELDHATDIARQVGRPSRDDAVFLAKAFRLAGVATADAGQAPAPVGPPPSADPVDDQRRGLRQARRVKVGQFGAAFQGVVKLEDREAYRLVNRRLMDCCGGVRVEDATLAQLSRSLRLLDGWTAAIRRAITDGSADRWRAEWEAGIHDVD